MNAPPINYGTIPAEDIVLNAAELAARLYVKKGFQVQSTEECFEELKKVISCKFCSARVGVKHFGDKGIDCGFGAFESAALKRNLADSDEAFVFALTLGLGVDRLLAKLAYLSDARHFITDALASAAVEAASDIAEAQIKGGLKCRPRFGPGYGDLSLEVQPGLLAMINAQKLLGIRLGEGFLMSPMKSITAIMGIENEQ